MSEDESEDDEPIVIKMISNQLARKKSVKERIEMNYEVPIHVLREEIAKMFRKELALDEKKRHFSQEEQRLDLC